MQISQPPVTSLSSLVVDSDLDFQGTYQVKNLAAPASGEALRKGNKDIANAEVSDSAAIAQSKLNAAFVPSGQIAIWSGTIANIPTGWLICDGNNGTPNLLATFIEGVATAATNPGATGGAKAKTTAGHSHTMVMGGSGGGGTANWITSTNTDTIADIRPVYYDVAFIMKA